METKLLLVDSLQKHQRILLESQYLSKGEYFVVPTNETETVEAIVRSICFEYFQNSMPVLAQKLKEFADNSLRMSFSLTLFRDIMNLLSQEQSSHRNLKQYFQQMNRAMGEWEPQSEQVTFELDRSVEEDKDYLFQQAQKGQMRTTRLLEAADLSDELEQNCKLFVPAKTITAQTQQTATKFLNPEDNPPLQPLERSNNNILNFFYSAQTNMDQNWWKNQRHVSDQSKEISKFERRGGKVLNQKSITRLVIDEIKRDLNRQIELGRDIQKHEDAQLFKFNKLMKGKLINAKMKKKSKR